VEDSRPLFEGLQPLDLVLHRDDLGRLAYFTRGWLRCRGSRRGLEFLKDWAGYDPTTTMVGS